MGLCGGLCHTWRLPLGVIEALVEVAEFRGKLRGLLLVRASREVVLRTVHGRCCWHVDLHTSDVHAQVQVRVASTRSHQGVVRLGLIVRGDRPIFGRFHR